MHLTLSLTHQCNLRCTYCYGGQKAERRMSRDVLLGALDLAFSHIDPLVIVTPFGGEPLLEPDLLDFMATEIAKRSASTGKKSRLGVTTNGTLISGRRLDLLEKHHFEVTVSLDGDREAHDCARLFPDGSGSFGAAIEGLKRARERLGQVRTVSVVHPGNVERLAPSFDLIASLGVNHMNFNPDYESGWDDGSLDRLENALEALTDRVVEQFRAGNDVAVQPFHGKIITRLKNGYCARDMCDFGCSEIAVAPSGNLYPCDRLVGEDGPDQQDVVIGHVDTGVDAEKVRSMREPKDTPRSDCEGCEIIERCMWWCGCVNRALTGSVDGVSDMLCRVEQMNVKAADRFASTLYSEENPAFLRRYYLPAAGRVPSLSKG